MIYFLTIFILFLFSILSVGQYFSKKQLLICNAVLYVLLAGQVGLRWETGTDWLPYLNNFLDTDDINIVFFNSLIGFEIGYGLFVYFIRSFTQDYTLFLVIHAIIYYFLIFKSNKHISPYPFVSLLLFYVSTIGVLGSNRQLLALSICLYSVQFVMEKKPIKFFALIFIGFLFHTTAIIFSVYYFLNRDFKKHQIYWALIIAIVVGKTTLPNIFFSGLGNLLGGSSASKAEIYSQEGSLGDFSLSIFGLIRRLVYFIVFFFYYDVLTKKIIAYKLIFNGFLCGLIFYFLFSDSLLILVNRGSLYFNIMEVFLITSLLFLFKSRKDKMIIVVLLFFYSFYVFFQSISAYSDLFLPYKGIFINSEFKRNLY